MNIDMKQLIEKLQILQALQTISTEEVEKKYLLLQIGLVQRKINQLGGWDE